MKHYICFDFETKSGKDIKKTGKIVYLNDKRAGIKCLAYKIDGSKTKLWLPGNPAPEGFRKTAVNSGDYHYIAFNSEFDRAVINILGIRHGFGHLPLEKTTDAMALCGLFTFPQKLSKAGKALRLRTQKQPKGAYYIKKVCCPDPKTGDFEYTRADFIGLCNYCIQDVDTLYELILALPTRELVGDMRRVWEHTMRINERGLPIDIAAVHRILEVIDHARGIEESKLATITDGAVTTVGQLARMKDFAASHGLTMADMTKDTVSEALTWELVPAVREMLEVRSKCGGAAVKKYPRLQNMTYKGIIHDNIRFCGAGTGRDSGMGFQPQNLPRAKVSDPTAEIQKFYDTKILQENPFETAKDLIRSMIRAPEGKVLNAADYSSIEYILGMWYCKETDKVESFRKGLDPYKTFATTIFDASYDAITMEQRQDCKPAVLGCLYFLGWRGYIDYAAGYGVEATPITAQRTVNVYRRNHPKVRKMWGKLQSASLTAVKTGRKIAINNVLFHTYIDRNHNKWLCIRLPSGRNMYYFNPKVVSDKFGAVVQFWGMNSKNKQWSRMKLAPQVIINNVIQGMAYDIMMDGDKRLAEAGFTTILRVHDEIVCLEDRDRLKEMLEIMSIAPKWCSTMPLRADGFVGERYKK